MTGLVTVVATAFFRQELPIDLLRKHHLLMAHVDDLIESGAKHVALTGFHDVPRLHYTLQINVLEQ